MSKSHKAISIVFIGSGPVAAKALSLLNQDFTVEAVITKPRPAHHRGSFPVIELAQKLKLPLHQVSSRHELTELIRRESFNSRIALLIDFGIIVSQEVIDSFPLGILNSHFSVLPEWRGADPITFAILSGQPETGVTLMQLVAGMDEGPIVGYKTYLLDKDITTPRLTEDLIRLSHKLILEKLPHYIADPQTQDQSVTGRQISYSRKLTKADGKLDWQKPAVQLEREIRAFQPWPGSYTTLAGKQVGILSASITNLQGKPGEIVQRNKELFICCGQDTLQILSLKPAGKTGMSTAAFLAGYRLSLASYSDED